VHAKQSRWNKTQRKLCLIFYSDLLFSNWSMSAFGHVFSHSVKLLTALLIGSCGRLCQITFWHLSAVTNSTKTWRKNHIKSHAVAEITANNFGGYFLPHLCMCVCVRVMQCENSPDTSLIQERPPAYNQQPTQNRVLCCGQCWDQDQLIHCVDSNCLRISDWSKSTNITVYQFVV